MIYCVEDDNGIRNLMLYTLSASGFDAKGFETPREFWAAMEDRQPELILLDVMLPGQDGISILKQLRADISTCDIPVIMASAKGTEYDKVLGLDLGADDYLAKPFGMMEMVSRVRSVLRRTSPGASVVLTCGSICLDTGKHSVTVDGQPVVLTLKEYDLLHLFLKNKGLVLTRERLLEQVWSQDYMGETRTVDVHIGTLRTKLGEEGRRIETVRGVGYRMEDKK
ncbi:MAG: response regulator transcription factor [Firmicutes bacterium]|nr:response regulator transcription factor [Bacillota bacterium]